jgi:hypothetical protein
VEFAHSLEKDVDAGRKLRRLCTSKEQFAMAYRVAPELKNAARIDDLSGHVFFSLNLICQLSLSCANAPKRGNNMALP